MESFEPHLEGSVTFSLLTLDVHSVANGLACCVACRSFSYLRYADLPSSMIPRMEKAVTLA